MLTAGKAGIVFVGVAIIAVFANQWVMDTISACWRGAIDIALRGHFGHITVFWKFNHAVAAYRFGFQADAKIQGASVAIWALRIVVTA